MLGWKSFNTETGFVVIRGSGAAVEALIGLLMLLGVPFVRTELVECLSDTVLTPVPHDPPAYPMADADGQAFMQREHARSLSLQGRREVAFVGGCAPFGEWNPARTHVVSETGPALLSMMIRKLHAAQCLSALSLQWFEFVVMYLQEGAMGVRRIGGGDTDVERVITFDRTHPERAEE